MSILISKDTTFIVQGITGREAVNLTRENLAYGAKIVGGVTPGRAGRDVYGVPVYDCVRDITAKTHVDGTVTTLPSTCVFAVMSSWRGSAARASSARTASACSRPTRPSAAASAARR